LTAHVDFAALAQVAQAHRARWLGTVPQGSWLAAMGIEARAEALSRAAPHLRGDIRAAKERLTGDTQMGVLFNVMGLAHPDWPPGAGFPPPS